MEYCINIYSVRFRAFYVSCVLSTHYLLTNYSTVSDF